MKLLGKCLFLGVDQGDESIEMLRFAEFEGGYFEVPDWVKTIVYVDNIVEKDVDKMETYYFKYVSVADLFEEEYETAMMKECIYNRCDPTPEMSSYVYYDLLCQFALKWGIQDTTVNNTNVRIFRMFKDEFAVPGTCYAVARSKLRSRKKSMQLKEDLKDENFEARMEALFELRNDHDQADFDGKKFYIFGTQVQRDIIGNAEDATQWFREWERVEVTEIIEEYDE